MLKGNSKTVQNELLGITFKTFQCIIQQEIGQADPVAAIADDTTDVGKSLTECSGLQVNCVWKGC